MVSKRSWDIEEYSDGVGILQDGGISRPCKWNNVIGILCGNEDRQAMKYYKAAAEEEMCTHYHVMHTVCYKVEDSREMSELLKIASTADDTEALVHLADCYLYGRGVGKDSKEAFRFYSEAEKSKDSRPVAGMARLSTPGKEFST